ncbi:hypothetical protein [Amycolatopsis sp. NPDC052450]|uniref:hypothetical protein n=1 Tax=Amycolatopsis sp. NPDC052450 TaxID=3363937 RepID=UPI0037C67DFA
MTLSVVYVPDTGHVVGAVGVTGTPAPVEVSALIGPALPLRVTLGAGKTAVLTLRDRQLTALAADDEPGAFTDPLAFGVEQVEGPGSVMVAKPALRQLRPWIDKFAFDAVGLTVTVPSADNTRDTPVMALVSDGAETRVLAGAIAEGQKSVTLPVSVDSGPHGVLVLVAGWAGRLEAVTKP